MPSFTCGCSRYTLSPMRAWRSSLSLSFSRKNAVWFVAQTSSTTRASKSS